MNFSIIEGEFTELILTLNAKTEASVSFKNTIYKNFTTCVAGAEISCSPFVGILSDLFVLNASWDLVHQTDFYFKYENFQDGERCVQIKDD